MRALKPNSGSSEGVFAEPAGDLEELLSSRLSRPEDLMTYLSASPAWVRREARRTQKILNRFAEAVVDAMESPGRAEDFLRRLDLRSIQRDHNWRRIFSELADRTPRVEGHRRAVIIRYMQYLSERKRLLDYVEAQFGGLEETMGEKPDPGGAPSQGDPERGPGFGATVIAELGPSAGLSVRFATLPFELHNEDTGALRLSGPRGFDRMLKLGSSVLGRHPECDIGLDPRWRTISRVHAVIDWDREWGEPGQPGVLRITNLSSQGITVEA